MPSQYDDQYPRPRRTDYSQTNTARPVSSRQAGSSSQRSGSPRAQGASRPSAGVPRSYGNSYGSGAGRRPPHKKQRSILSMVITDVVILGICLCIFALFHHVIPRAESEEPQQIIVPGQSQTASPSESPQTSGSQESPSPLPSESTAAVGDFSATFGDKFISGDPVVTDSGYQSENISLTITRQEKDGSTYFVADFYVKNIENFKTAFAQGKFGRSISADMVDMAKENNAIVALSGDYYGFHDEGVVIRNGALYRESVGLDDLCVLYYDGTMKTYSPSEFSIEQAVSGGAWQAWSFGPMLLKDGKAMTEFNSTVKPKNPRSAIGYYEPGHYCFVVVDGRQEGYSVGMTMAELSQLFEELGCKEAYNLDGGGSAAMVYQGELVNQPSGGGRKISDMLYLGEE